MWHFLNFFPEPHQHGSFRPIPTAIFYDACSSKLVHFPHQTDSEKGGLSGATQRVEVDKVMWPADGGLVLNEQVFAEDKQRKSRELKGVVGGDPGNSGEQIDYVLNAAGV
jgi:hypothetical protein